MIFDAFISMFKDNIVLQRISTPLRQYYTMVGVFVNIFFCVWKLCDATTTDLEVHKK